LAASFAPFQAAEISADGLNNIRSRIFVKPQTDNFSEQATKNPPMAGLWDGLGWC
jgi:hypothetical protein